MMRHFQIATVAILGWMALVAGPVHASGPYELPIRLSDDNHMIIDVMVNDQGPFAFVVDTAAGSTIVFDQLVEVAALEEIEGGPIARVQGASGVIQVPFVQVGELRVGDWRFDLDQAIALPDMASLNEEIYGILGVDVLLRQPVGFSLSDNTLNIYAGNQTLDPNADLPGQWSPVSYETRAMTGLFLWSEVTVNGIVMQALIDTGARRTVINSAGAAALGFDVASSDLHEAEPIRGGTNNSAAAWILPVSTVQFGARIWGSRNLTLSDPSVLAALGVAEEPTLIFGSDFMAEQNFIIDPIANVIWMQGRRSAAFGGVGPSAPVVENLSPVN